MAMGKRGPKPKGKVKIEWSADFAYAIGLIATDGCVYSNMRHINLTSKDAEQILHYKIALKIRNKITMKARSSERIKKYYVVQISDRPFAEFLGSIGITPAKSKTIESVKVPNEFFFDFLRGCFDGDGTFYSYWDPRWCSSFMFYLAFASASRKFINWLQGKISELTEGVHGHVTSDKAHTYWQLKYAKKESEQIIRRMYYSDKILYLSRKKLKINRALAMMGIAEVS
jgi:hypothetical protein